MQLLHLVAHQGEEGETTSTVPSISAAAPWKERLLPEPVGITPSELCPSRVRLMSASWAGRGDPEAGLDGPREAGFGHPF